MLQAMNTGHDGSMSTLHANDARETLDRLELMIALSGAELPSNIARQYICNAVDLVIHVTRLQSGHRVVTRISEVTGLKDGEWCIDDVFVYRMTGEVQDGRPAGSFFATGYQPVALRRLAMGGMNTDQFRSLFEARELSSVNPG
jgi:pilus assembly protein CpaF